MTRPIRPEDVLNLKSAGSVALHPDGEHVAFTINWPDLDSDSYRSQIHVHDGATSRQLTDGHRDTSPQFSPEGTHIAFLRSEHKGKPQPAVVELATGEVQLLEPFEDGVSQLRWATTGMLIALAITRPDDQVGVDDDEIARRPRVITGTDYRFNGKGWTHDRPSMIYTIDIESGQRTQVASPARDHSGIAVSADGSRLLAVGVTDIDAGLTGTNHVLSFSLPVASADDVTVLTPDGSAWTGDLGWLDDGRPFSVGQVDRTKVEFSKIHALDPNGTAAPLVIGDADVNASSMLGTAHSIAVAGAALGPGVRGGKVTIDRHDLASNTSSILVEFDGGVTSFGATHDASRIVATVATPTRPAELWEITSTGKRCLVELNSDLLAELDLAPVETISLPSSDGVQVEAFVCTPPPSAPDTGWPRPGLVYVHGGPMSTFGLSFFDEFQIAAAEGYVVIGGNPRGSDGYGQAWAQAPIGRFGTVDWEDVTAITDYLVARDDVDAERVGIGGGSYGGFMTAWAVGSTDRYKAALIERCVVNWESFAGTSDIGGFFGEQILRASPESDVAALRIQSPIHLAPKVTTPTLIVHSEEDWRCPPEQAEQLFAAYRRNGVDATFIRFPGENHELSRSGSPRHRLERFGFIGDFYAKHLLRTAR